MVVAALLAPSLAHADSGFYGLAGIGRHTTDIKSANAAAARTADTSASNRAYSVGGGYRIHRNFAVEGNYYDMGSSGQHEALGAVDARAATVSALAMLPIGNRAELFVRTGVGRMKLSVQREGAADASRRTGVRQFGVGGNVRVGKRSFVRGEWNVWGGGDQLKKGAVTESRVQAYNVTPSQFTVSYGLRF